ncbi:MAG: hypothetical protein R3B47_21070 [Bacteroidia bacterium]
MLSPEENQSFIKHFDIPLEEIAPEDFEKKKKRLTLRLHPDQKDAHEDEEYAAFINERFVKFKALCEKAEAYLYKKERGIADYGSDEAYLREDAVYSADGLPVEVITRDKNLKYEMFGSRYRWLERGEKYPIPKTDAFIRIEEDHRGAGVGFNEYIKMYLSFGSTRNLEPIIDWLFDKIKDKANGLIIQGSRIDIDKFQMGIFIRKTTFLQLAAGKNENDD